MKQKYRIALMACFLWLLPFCAGAQVDVLTYHNDNSRLGANLNETTLTPANVNSANFGKLFAYTVDGYVYAQPLYVSALNIPGQGVHNVVFVATEHNSVYAFDADSNGGTNGGLLWQVNLGPSAPAYPNNPTLPFHAIQPEIGITGTPVIDLPSETLYVDAFTEESGHYIHRIHALSILDGSEKPFSPVVVSASLSGKGAGSTNGVLPFQASQELQRCALTLANGILFVAYAGYTDQQFEDPFHGWILGYNASNLQLLPNYVFNSTPNGTTAQYGPTAGQGGIWMGGGGLAVDSDNNLYFSTGDGNFNAFPNTNGTEYGDSLIKLSTAGGLSVADYFTPYDESRYSTNDLDVGSGGVILLPDQPGPYPHLMIGAGKPQQAYLINRDMMTTDGRHINTSGTDVDNIVQEMPLGGGSFGTPAYFNEQIYYIATKDVIRSYVLSDGTLTADLPGTSGTRPFGFPGATPSISANGANDGIVWAVQNANPAVLVAYNATNLSTELYNSTQAGNRDQLTAGVKFAVPTIANGKVYVGGQQALSVFGLFDQSPPPQWAPVAANYSGLFFESSGAEFGASGAVNISTTKNGNYSGKLELAAVNYSFHGKFDANGAATFNVSQKKSSGLAVTLQVNTNDNNSISGTVSSDSWSADFLANRAVFNGHGNPAPFKGTYNLTFEGPGNGDPTEPQNNGTGTVSVNSSGVAKFKGVLGDGTRVSQSASISESGDWPLFLSLYGRQGELIGWLNFKGSTVGGQTTWIKQPNPKSKTYPGGFTLNPTASGSTQ